MRVPALRGSGDGIDEPTAVRDAGAGRRAGVRHQRRVEQQAPHRGRPDGCRRLVDADDARPAPLLGAAAERGVAGRADRVDGGARDRQPHVWVLRLDRVHLDVQARPNRTLAGPGPHRDICGDRHLQHGGLPNRSAGGWISWLAIVAINLLAVSVVSWFVRVREREADERQQAISDLTEANDKLAASLRENAGLHAQLVAQAREAGILDERQRMAREIHDTLAQGLVGIITQLEAAAQAPRPEDECKRHTEGSVAGGRYVLGTAPPSSAAMRDAHARVSSQSRRSRYSSGVFSTIVRCPGPCGSVGTRPPNMTCSRTPRASAFSTILRGSSHDGLSWLGSPVGPETGHPERPPRQLFAVLA